MFSKTVNQEYECPYNLKKTKRTHVSSRDLKVFRCTSTKQEAGASSSVCILAFAFL